MVRLHKKESTLCIKFLSDYDINAEFKHIFTEKVLASLRKVCMICMAKKGYYTLLNIFSSSIWGFVQKNVVILRSKLFFKTGRICKRNL